MKFGPKPFGPMRLVVKGNSSEYTISRPTTTVGSMGDVQESVSQHTANVWIYNEDEFTLNIDIGERLDGDTQGIALYEEDLDVDDRITYAGDTFEITGTVEIPTAKNPKLVLIELTKMTNA